MPTATFTRSRVLRIARSQLGTSEVGYTNDNKYGRWYPMNLQPWCDMFVSWVLWQAGNPDGYKSAYTPGGAAFWKGRGQWVEPRDLQPGDIVYFNFPGDGIDRISHVGIVERVLANGTVVCIEGNTSSGDAGSQRDGGGVHRRVRPLSYIVGAGRPSYAGAAAAAPLPMLREGSMGKTVRELHKDLRVLGYTVDVTDSFKAATAAAVRTFQRDHGLGVDGVVGPVTWSAIAKALRAAGKPQDTTKKPGAGREDTAGEKNARDVEQRISRKKALRLVAATEAEIDKALDELEDELRGAA